MKTTLAAATLALACCSANAQGIYHCTKNGKKLMTDQPCQAFGADTKKHVRYDDMPPLNTMEPPSQAEIQRARQSSSIQHTQHRSEETNSPQTDVKASQKKAVCMQLEQEKQQIVSMQRAPQSGGTHDHLRARREKIEAEIYRRECETM